MVCGPNGTHSLLAALAFTHYRLTAVQIQIGDGHREQFACAHTCFGHQPHDGLVAAVQRTWRHGMP